MSANNARLPELVTKYKNFLKEVQKLSVWTVEATGILDLLDDIIHSRAKKGLFGENPALFLPEQQAVLAETFQPMSEITNPALHTPRFLRLTIDFVFSAIYSLLQKYCSAISLASWKKGKKLREEHLGKADSSISSQWEKGFGNRILISWQDFFSHFKTQFPIPEVGIYFLDYTNTGYISMFRLGALLRLFGPSNKISQTIREVCSSSDFHGYFALLEAHKYLNSLIEGSFIFFIDMSSYELTAGYVDENKKPTFKHNLLKSGKLTYAKKHYTNLLQLSQASSTLKHSVITSLPSQQNFLGFVTADESKVLLKQQKVGTFFFRCSSQQGFAVSYVSEKGVKHSTLERTIAGWKLESYPVEFKTLADVISRTKSLVHPFQQHALLPDQNVYAAVPMSAATPSPKGDKENFMHKLKSKVAAPVLQKITGSPSASPQASPVASPQASPYNSRLGDSEMFSQKPMSEISSIKSSKNSPPHSGMESTESSKETLLMNSTGNKEKLPPVRSNSGDANYGPLPPRPTELPKLPKSQETEKNTDSEYNGLPLRTDSTSPKRTDLDYNGLPAKKNMAHLSAALSGKSSNDSIRSGSGIVYQVDNKRPVSPHMARPQGKNNVPPLQNILNHENTGFTSDDYGGLPSRREFLSSGDEIGGSPTVKQTSSTRKKASKANCDDYGGLPIRKSDFMSSTEEISKTTQKQQPLKAASLHDNDYGGLPNRNQFSSSSTDLMNTQDNKQGLTTLQKEESQPQGQGNLIDEDYGGLPNRRDFVEEPAPADQEDQPKIISSAPQLVDDDYGGLPKRADFE